MIANPEQEAIWVNLLLKYILYFILLRFLGPEGLAS